ncbi:hypothetical protein HNI00_21025 [Thermoleptolyngbya oregonensis NK1-22]|uniref:Uncharacterized protein n=1 Tax=Thermoleptolyngbya oregonensis NK1-22 TaxID=2547457 RepID=A0AA96YEE4_9CYAN|nr:hypothetical protein [Thermoleptolyngbya oregonensis]WOB45335.1 hypothetical protein HNI00_21025 [Thermoleptolyngbya oregonensis NK1-22]
MWKRRTFHECAEELEILSQDFRDAYINPSTPDQQIREKILQESSERGIEILRMLALSIRSEQDFGAIPTIRTPVGALKRSASTSEVLATLNSYRPPYGGRTGFELLSLREALNKIAHADPYRTGFFVDNTVHDLILSGNHGSNTWIAIVSITDLCRAIKSLPDQNVQSV